MDIVIQNEIPTDFYIIVSGAVVRYIHSSSQVLINSNSLKMSSCVSNPSKIVDL